VAKRDSRSSQMPHEVARRIVKRSAGDEVVVVVPRNGRPARVFGYDEYTKMKGQPQKHKPWLRRKTKSSLPDPLGAVKGRVSRALDRGEIYE